MTYPPVVARVFAEIMAAVPEGRWVAALLGLLELLRESIWPALIAFFLVRVVFRLAKGLFLGMRRMFRRPQPVPVEH